MNQAMLPGGTGLEALASIQRERQAAMQHEARINHLVREERAWSGRRSVAVKIAAAVTGAGLAILALSQAAPAALAAAVTAVRYLAM